MRILGDLILSGLGQLKGLRVENLVTDPSSPSVGQVWYNSTEGHYKGFDGTTISTFASGGSTGAVQTELDTAELAAGLNADGSFTAPTGTTYLGSATTLKAADVLLDSAVKAVADSVALSDTAASSLLSEVNAVELAAGLNTDGTWTAPIGTTYLASASSLKNADVLLDVQIKANADQIVLNTSDVALKLNKAGDTMTGNLVISAGSHVSIADAAVSGTDAVNLNTLQTYTAQLRYRLEVKARDVASLTLPTGASFTVDTYVVADGDRILFTGLTSGANQVYVAAGVGTTITWTAAKDFGRADALPVEGDTLVVAFGSIYSEAGFTWNGTAWVQFNGGTQVMPGVGINKSGNVISVLLGAGISELPTADVGIDLHAASGLFLTVDGIAASTSIDSQLSIMLDGTALAVSSLGLKVASQGITGYEIAASVAGAGLTGGAGSALAVGASTGIVVNADSIAFDETYGDLRYLNTAGDTLTGALILAAAPLVDLEAATKKYVDDLATKVAGGTFVYTGATAATTHVVPHNLGHQYNGVTVYDSADKVIIPDSITADSTTQLTVTFASAITCKIVVNGTKI